MQNPGSGTASLGKAARGGAAAAPTVVDATDYKLNPVSADVIKRLTGVQLPSSGPMRDFEGYHSRS